MNAETEAALRASIAKWEGNAEAETPDAVKIGSDECPLCALFAWNNCVGCPVSKRTGLEGCGGTPYYVASGAFFGWKRASPGGKTAADFGNAFRAEARKEADFLKSLLSEG